jgi:hypothetical protein
VKTPFNPQTLGSEVSLDLTRIILLCTRVRATALTVAAEWQKWANVLPTKNSIGLKCLVFAFASKGRGRLLSWNRGGEPIFGACYGPVKSDVQNSGFLAGNLGTVCK